MRALIVVPTLNEVSHLEGVVTSLLAGISPSTLSRLAIVDGGSSDGTVTLARELEAIHAPVTLLHNPRRIQSAALNLAVRQLGADADVLIRCDAHAEYPPAFCDRLLATLERTGADAVVVPLDSKGERGLERVVAWVSNSPVGTGGSAHRAGTISGFVDHGHHAAFRLDVFRRAGGYDESFTHNEDAELDCRQRALGARVFLDAEIRVGYRPRASLEALWRQYFKYGAGRSRTARRHPRSLRARQIALPLNLGATSVAVLVSPWEPALLSWPAAYVSALTLATLHLALRQRAWLGLLAGPVALTMHTAWALGFIAGLVQRREAEWRPDAVVPLQLEASAGERA
jgi:succinoglycan biosynthesis protein ExoA